MRTGEKADVASFGYSLANTSSKEVFALEINHVSKEVTIMKALPESEFLSWDELDHSGDDYVT